VLALGAALFLAGCGAVKNNVTSSVTITERGRPATVPGQERSFAGALEFLRAGNEQGARELLERVVEAPSITGITDEAYFRLALLHLRDEGVKGAARAKNLLERLAYEYPKSIWTRQAAPLAHYLEEVKDLRDRQREIKTLRDLNLSLSRGNRDLRQTIERLKNLDLELDQSIKR
jgi:hypothetical protein